MHSLWSRRAQQPHLFGRAPYLSELRQAHSQHEGLLRAPRQGLLLAVHVPRLLELGRCGAGVRGEREHDDAHMRGLR